MITVKIRYTGDNGSARAFAVETVVLLSDKKIDGHINIDLDVEKLEDKSVASK